MCEARYDCQNPLCGCGRCEDYELPDKDCPFVICGCGMCCEDIFGDYLEENDING